MKSKLKTSSAAKKRFRITKSGHVKYAPAFSGHNFLHKSGDRKRKYRKVKLAHASNMHEMPRLLPYGR